MSTNTNRLTPPDDFEHGGLRTMFINCTWRRNATPSHAALLMGALVPLMRSNGGEVDALLDRLIVDSGAAAARS